MSVSFLRATLLASLLVFVAACGEKPAGSGAAPAVTADAGTPEGAILRSAALLKQGDIAGVMQNTMPPAAFEKAKADWTKDRADKPITDEERKKFADTMGKLTAPDAEKALYAEIEPQLKAFDAQYQQQMPMYVAMGSAWLQSMVQQNKDMSDEDRQQANAAIVALGDWVQKTRFTDPALIQKVLAIGTQAAREVNLKTLDEAHALDFDQSMQKARTVFLATKNALAVYGFSVDDVLDSVKPEVVSSDGNTAKVKVGYTLFDKPLSVETEMVKVDGRWYGKRAIDRRRAGDGAAPAPADTPATALTPAPAAAETH